MGIVIGLALAIAMVAVVVWPLVRPGRTGSPAAARRSVDLANARAEIYRQIAQAEQDRAAGLIERADLEAQVADLRMQAARILKEESELAPDDRRLEEEIARVRGQMRMRGTPGIEDSKGPREEKNDS